MLTLRAFNREDIDKEYEFLSSIPEEENGVINKFSGWSKERFLKQGVPYIENETAGINLPAGYVHQSYYFLWKEDTIIGYYKIRHYLNDSLRNGSGHIGCFIKKEYRGQGYGTQGLTLAIVTASKIIKEDEIYMACYKWNKASLRVQQKCGAYIHHEDSQEYYTRIKRLDI